MTEAEAQMLARIAALEDQLTELRAQLERRQPLRRTLRCECGSRSILLVKSVMTIDSRGATREHALGYDTGFLSLHTPRGPLQAYVCKECRRVEWYATQIAQIPVDNENIIEYDAHDPTPDAPPPFR